MGRAKKKDITNRCVDCGCVISKRAKRCVACAGKETSKRFASFLKR